MLKMPYPVDGFEYSEGGGGKIVWWCPYRKELDSSNSTSFNLM